MLVPVSDQERGTEKGREEGGRRTKNPLEKQQDFRLLKTYQFLFPSSFLSVSYLPFIVVLLSYHSY